MNKNESKILSIFFIAIGVILLGLVFCSMIPSFELSKYSIFVGLGSIIIGIAFYVNFKNS